MAADDRRMARATLGAAIFAGVAALGGSALTYQQAQAAVSASTAQKVAELRMSAYGSMSDEFSALRQRYSELARAAAEQGRQLTKQEAAELLTSYYGLLDTEGRVRILAPDEVRTAMQEVDRALFTAIHASDVGESGAPVTLDRFNKLFDEIIVALFKFYDAARESIVIANGDAS